MILQPIRKAWHAVRNPRRALEDWRGWNAHRRLRAQLQAAYEAAMPRDDLWTLADFKDADASLLPHVRRQLRSRARYEAANNALVDRVIGVWVGDVCGDAGPALQVHSGLTAVDRFLERAWDRWWQRSNQAQKLRTAVRSEAVDGEAVGVLTSNRRLSAAHQPVTIDVVGLESDRLASPDWQNANRSDYVDGVHLDPLTREPVKYDILRAHPGTEYLDAIADMFEHDTFDAGEVLHAFRRQRPEQHRGVCRYVPVLPVSGLHRKYVEAECARNQIRAAFAFIIKSTAPGDSEGGVGEDKWWQEVHLPNRQGVGTMLPDQYDITQLRPDGTANELDAFHRIIGGLVSGCFAMPVGRALGVYTNSSYPGVRAEMQPYHRAIATDRYQVWEPLWLRPLYEAFLSDFLASREWREFFEVIQETEEWQLLVRKQPAGFRADESLLDLYEIEWNWPEKELVVDPSREETARKTRLSMGLTDREREMDSPDLEERDRRAAKMFGIDDVQVYRRMVAQATFGIPVPDATAPADAAPEGGGAVGGEFGSLNRRQWQNNRKAIRDCLEEFIAGTSSDAVTLQMLQSLGLPESRAQALIDDARDSTIDDPDLQDVPIESVEAGYAAAGLLNANCGTGDGGFQPGNDCGGGKGGGSGVSPKSERTLQRDKRFQKRAEALRNGELRTKDGEVIGRDERMTEVQQTAVIEYTDRGAAALNPHLRGLETASSVERRRLEARAEAIESGLSQLPPFEGTTWRGLESAHVADLQPGDHYSDQGFLSTSQDRNHPRLTTGAGRAILTVKGKTGRSIEHTAANPSEREVLFRRAVRFTVAERSTATDGTLHLTLEEV